MQEINTNNNIKSGNENNLKSEEKTNNQEKVNNAFNKRKKLSGLISP